MLEVLALPMDRSDRSGPGLMEMTMKLIFEHAVPRPPRSPRTYRVPEVRIMMVKEGVMLAPKFSNSLQVYHALKEIVAYTDREYFLVACLDTKNKPLAINIATIGTLDSSVIHPREVFKTAVLCGAAES